MSREVYLSKKEALIFISCLAYARHDRIRQAISLISLTTSFRTYVSNPTNKRPIIYVF